METILLINSILLWVLMLFNILLTIGLARRISRQFPKLEFLKAGRSAPDFFAWDLDGKRVSRKDFIGRTTAFIFISPHCKPCREEIPKLKMLLPDTAHRGIYLILVSDSGEEETRKFLEETGVQWPALIAPRDRTSFLMDYKAAVTPSYCLVDAQGKVQAAGAGLADLKKEFAKVA